MFRYAETDHDAQYIFIEVRANTEDLCKMNDRYRGLVYYVGRCPICGFKNIYVPGVEELNHRCKHSAEPDRKRYFRFAFEREEKVYPESIVLLGLGI